MIYTEKDVPHPQDFLALGLVNSKPFPLSPSEKSKTVQAKKTNAFLGI